MKKKRVHVIAHTHWDREWYQPFAQFRYRLVAMIDEVLDRLTTIDSADSPSAAGGAADSSGSRGAPSPDEFTYFHLDGQTVVIEDYLALRPEREEELRRLIAAGRILVGPWYAQPDETLVSGEALIRNLLIGMEEADAYGGTMHVGYVPDIFGHIGQFPQILAGFGIDNAFLWRGMVPPPTDKPVTEFTWQAPSGHRVLGIYLSTSGYFTAPRIDEQAGVPTIVQDLARKSASSELLLMNGADHHHIQADLPSRLRELNEGAQDFTLELSTLPGYLEALRREILPGGDTQDGSALHTVTGELRETRRSPEGLFLLYGTLSARMPVKIANFHAQRRLERVLEPLEAVTDGAGTTRRWLRYAWKTLLKNHAHDSICGCSVDQVVRDMDGRFREVEQLAEMIESDLLRALSRMPRSQEPRGPSAEDAQEPALNEERTGGAASAFRRSQRVAVPFLLHNAAGVSRRDTAIVDIVLPESVPPQPFQRAAAGAAHAFVVRDSRGAELPVQVLQVRPQRSVATNPRSFPNFTEGYRVKLAFPPAQELPPLAGSAFALEEHTGPDPVPAPKEALTVQGVRRGGGVVLSNSVLRVTLSGDGEICLTDNESGTTIEDVLTIVDDGDIGDLYNYSPPPEDRVISSRNAVVTSVDLTATGPLVAQAVLSLQLDLPVAASKDRRSRKVERRPVPVELTLTLRGGATTVEIGIGVDNSVEDHRLRALVRTPSHGGSDDDGALWSVAQAAFTVERRPAVASPVPAELWREDAPNTHPFHGWCAVEGSTSRSWEPADRGPELAAAEFTAAPSAAAGIAVFSRGLPEYQLLRQDEASFLAVTLFRSVSRVHARGSLTIDRRAWGIPFRTPLAQCTGRHQFDLAIHPFSGSWAHAGVDHTAESFVFDYACLQIPPEKPAREGAAGAVVPPHEVEPVVAHVDQSGILMSSLKMAESGHGVIVRFWNNRDAEREVHIRVSGRFSAADRCDLREQPVEQCAINRASAPASDGAPADVPGGVVTIAFGPWEIVTLRLS